MSTILKNKKTLYWGITILLTVGCYFLPLGEVYTPVMKRFFAITVLGLCILAFELMHNFALGMLLPSLWVMFGVTDFATAFSPYVSTNIFVLVNAFLFAMVLTKTGFLNRIGYALIVKSGGTYNSGVWALLLIGIVLSFVSMMNATIIIATIGFSMAVALGIKPTDKAAVPIFTALVLGAANSKVICYSPISITIMNASVQAVIPDFTIDYFSLVLHNLPMVLFIVLFMWAVLKWYEKSSKKDGVSYDLEGFKAEYKEKYEALGKMSKNEKIAACTLCGIFLWMLLNTLRIIPFDVVYAFILANIFLFSLGIATTEDVKNVNYSITFVVMAFVAVGTVAGKIGATSLVTAGVASVLGSLGTYWASFGTAVFGTLANFVLTPYAMMSMLPATVAAYCQQLGMSFLPHLYATYLAGDIVFFPYEYPLILLIYGFGICSMPKVIKMLTAKALASLVFIVAIMMPYWYILGLYA